MNAVPRVPALRESTKLMISISSPPTANTDTTSANATVFVFPAFKSTRRLIKLVNIPNLLNSGEIMIDIKENKGCLHAYLPFVQFFNVHNPFIKNIDANGNFQASQNLIQAEVLRPQNISWCQ